MCTQARIPSASRRNESASSKSFAVSGSIVNVSRSRRSTRPSRSGSGARAARRRARPRSTSRASSTFSIRVAGPSTRSTLRAAAAREHDGEVARLTSRDALRVEHDRDAGREVRLTDDELAAAPTSTTTSPDLRLVRQRTYPSTLFRVSREAACGAGRGKKPKRRASLSAVRRRSVRCGGTGGSSGRSRSRPGQPSPDQDQRRQRERQRRTSASPPGAERRQRHRLAEDQQDDRARPSRRARRTGPRA